MYWIVFFNDEHKTFNVVGPVSSDEQTTDYTAELQHKGEDVRIDVVLTSKESKESLIAHFTKEGLKLDPKVNWLRDR